MEFQNASVVWPDKVRPEASVMVRTTMMGRSVPALSSTSRTGEQSRLRVQGVEHRLDQQEIDAALDQRARAIE